MSDAKKTENPKTAQEKKPGKNIIATLREHPLFVEAALAAVIILLIFAAVYLQDAQSKIYIEKSEINAPIISLSPQIPGIIDKFYVREGDIVAQGQKLAKVGDEIISAKTSGIILHIMNTPGQFASPQSAIVQMIDPRELRILGRIQEDKGLSEIKVGQRVLFTVDAFGSKQYSGMVDSIGASARQSDIVFSISDKREEREFEVRAIFDTDAYPELKNGMSAKMWVYK